MQLWQKEVQTLEAFGLTHSQITVYLNLVRLGEDSKAKTIFKFSNVARQDIYRILRELQQLGLVKKIIAQPTRFRAIPINEAALILLRREERVFSKLKEKANELAKSSAEKFAKAADMQESGQFVLITEIEGIAYKTSKVIEKSMENLHYISPLRELAAWLAKLSDSFINAMDREVDIKWVTEIPKDSERLPKIVQTFVRNPQFRLRSVPYQTKAKMGIYDKKEIIMALLVAPDIGEAPALWSNNQSFVSIAEEYFDKIWEKGTDVTPKSFKLENLNQSKALDYFDRKG